MVIFSGIVYHRIFYYDKNVLFFYKSSTESCNHKRIDFEYMSCLTTLTWHIGVKTAFQANIFKANIFGLLLWRFNILRGIEENEYCIWHSLRSWLHFSLKMCFTKVFHFPMSHNQAKHIKIFVRSWIFRFQKKKGKKIFFVT